MDRRELLKWSLAAGALTGLVPNVFASQGAAKRLVLIELKGGNDGLNTLVPFADPKYHELRPKIGLSRDQVVQLTDQLGLHLALAPLKPFWDRNELAILQGVGYPAPNLSHFRSIEIWDTASRSDETLQQGWLTRALPKVAATSEFAADGVLIGNAELGPFVGGARAVTLANPAQFTNQARIAQDNNRVLPGALGHVAKVEADIVHAAARLAAPVTLNTAFPNGAFGNAVRAAAQVLATGAVPVVRLTLNGFDTHQNQLGTHAALLTQLAEGMTALRSAMQELNLWGDTLIFTYAEFGRRPRENASMGTDHGTASVHFAMGGRVHGGLQGASPVLTQLDSAGNPAYSIDFRSVYAAVLKDFLGLDARAALNGSFQPLPIIRV